MNRVVIIGGDHHNTLGLVRAFGKNAIHPDCLLTSEKKSSIVEKSRYVGSCCYFVSEEDAIEYLSTHYAEDREKVVVIPTSDRAACELDRRFDELSRHFILPSINQTPGAIEYFMDKKTQAEFATSRNIPIAKTQEVKLSPHFPENPIGQYPVIIKPIISAFGNKGDITVVRNSDEYNTALQDFAEKGYQSVLFQEYLDIDYEIVCFGAVLHQEPNICFAAVHIIRSWPKEGGTCSYSYLITDKDILDECGKILYNLKEIGYYGLFDVELFSVNGKIYLNEINWRNSGGISRAFSERFYYPYLWYCDAVGMNIEPEKTISPPNSCYAMTEISDISHVLLAGYPFHQWIKDFLRTKNFTVWDTKDPIPAVYTYCSFVKSAIRYGAKHIFHRKGNN